MVMKTQAEELDAIRLRISKLGKEGKKERRRKKRD
jgi:hypothetical protein